MKFISFIKKDGSTAAGVLTNDGRNVVDIQVASNGKLPNDLIIYIKNHEKYKDLLNECLSSNLKEGVYSLEGLQLTAPLPTPVSFRDFYAFEEHVKTARERRGLKVVSEWYEFPVFYFSNHLAIKGPDEPIKIPKPSERLDYELEIACIIGKSGINIRAEEAEDYIFGYCILNDWSARDIQAKEMKVGLGPAKGKDFATSIGPYIVTKDEINQYRIEDRYDLKMEAKVNGFLLSSGNFKDIHYTFGQMIERASHDVMLYPGEIIGSGTVGTGCILELGADTHRWLQAGDEVELSITGLGSLKNKIIE
ncbi:MULTISPECIES: fumarylacetoacetate hydrolase family protein [Sutcliffiella]|uniref:Fumarylacetoacetase n=1 Tax=Sutcliffiella cohnii TaxID=33932 RepID=A0A223KR56_9BACI|nr:MULTISPECIES: fumarylacetoacetate hydrolase family protein [Sutcliffiella]AST91803.1 fumarylacetoacetase [Sutcliffiella cohnii]WBL13020.1 fumarylacetoacetate hydrolase family protein [Sutcliffiella sp. NC1]